jgi:threonine dehydrogenase-like Zn-dependent dehydrogenase
MRAMVYRGPYRVRVEEKDRPVVEHPNDAIIRVTLAAVCGSDLHLYHGMGDRLGPQGRHHLRDGRLRPHVQRREVRGRHEQGLTISTNQCPVKRQWPCLFEHVRNGYLKPSDVITHRIPLEHIAEGYHIFSAKLDGCIKPLIVTDAA